MARQGGRDLAVGAVFALGLSVLALVVMALGGSLPGLSDNVDYHVVFPSADGLLMGAPVRMNGVTIGSVTGIRLPKDPDRLGIEVQVSVNPDYAERVREDSTAALRILQLLTDEKFVEISSGSSQLEALPSGSELPVQQGREFFEQSEAIAENLVGITTQLRRILEPLERGEGLLGQMIHDPEWGKRGVEALGQTLENTQVLVEEIRAGKGLVGRLIYDEQLAGKLDELAGSIDSFNTIVARLERGEGALGAMLAPDGKGDALLEDLAAAVASLRDTVARLEDESTLLGSLLAPGGCGEDVELRESVCETVAGLRQAVEQLNGTDGTLGALLNDRELVDGVEDLVTGTNDSKFVRYLLRNYRKRADKVEGE